MRFDYDDYAEFCESKTVVCRKPHRCDGCRKVIARVVHLILGLLLVDLVLSWER